MKLKTLFTTALLLAAGAVAQLSAQTAVTVGNKVTDANSLVSGNAYLIKYTSMTGTPYIYDAGTTTPLQAPSVQNAATKSCAFYFISDGNGAYKLENAYTGNYWPAPTGNQKLYPTTAANAGSWAISISSGTATMTCTNGGTTYGLDRLTPDVVGWSSRKTVEIYEISAATLSTTAAFTEFTDKDINISATAATSLTTGTWYVMKNIGRNVYAYEKTDAHKLYNQSAAPSGSAEDNAKFLVRLLNGTDGKYYLQNGLGNFVGAIPQNTAVPTTALIEEQISIAQIGDNAGYFYLRGTTDSRILDCQEPGYPVVGWGTDAPSATNSNAAWQFFPVELVDSWVPTIDEVYTINNTNSGRGALIYNSENPKYVWSSGKGGTFDASQANSQWVIIPTGTAGQYYLYNVGAGKFAIPSGIAQGAGNPWKFSDNAVAVVFETQGDGTKKIKMASTPVSGTNAAYLAVSNGQTYPIINYNDVGGNFTITKVDGQDQSTAANAAVTKLVKSQTALTSYPQATGWYVIQIKSKTGSDSYAGRYLQNSTTLYNDLYPLTFTGAIDVQPAITDPTFFTHIDYTSWDSNSWQLPDGRYLVSNSSSKFPTPSTTASNVICGYDNGNYFKSSANYYADPYNSNANYFIGETSYMRTAYTVYPIDLTTAGLTAWQVICNNAPDNAQITCSRNDVSGLTAVYKNGFFFLPTGVTPEESEFTLEGANGVTIDGTAHTITFAYDPSLAMVEGSVTVEQGWQTAGRDSEVMLLRVTAKPFKDAINTTMTVNLKDGSEANISSLKLYEANSSSPEIYSKGDGAPTKTEVATASISGSTATFTIGNLAAGTHYYWIGATVSSTATLGAVLDAAVTGISYQVEGQTEQDLNLTSVGDPADRGAMVFNVRSYPFLPRDNGSRVYRIPAMVVADDGSIVVAADKRYDRYDDIGKSHVIDIVIRRSTDGGKTWSEPVTIAKGENTTANGGNDERCGYGDPSLVKGKDGNLYCLFAAGNLGYFYGQKHIRMSTSTDNGVTWSSSESTPPVDIFATGAIQNATGVGAAGGYGLYDYFVTSGKGLYTSDGILMYLIPAQTLTADNYTMADGTYWGAASDDYLFYSTDDGATWYFSQTPMVIGGDEAKVIEMNDGSLFGSIRKGGPRRFNTATYTKNNDGTLNFAFGEQWDNNQLHQDSQNNQDILYYQRETKTGKTDIIFHSITTGNHTNFKLYYSIDQGDNWTEFLNVQTKGTRYVTLERGGSEENPGSLYMLFEDQSLNSAGGYTDYNHYPLNFIEITREQLESLIPTLNDAAKWKPAVSEVYTINNTNSNCGALIYNPDASTQYVWSSGKSGTFDASNANSQWVIIPTGVDNQYYLFNVGAGKFAIPTGIAQSASNSWVFSDNAVAVIFEDQADGTKKIKMATNPVSGTNAAYMAVSNSYTGPIINYNDVGGNFTITKVDGDASTAANAAVAKLVKSQTALKSYPQTTGWYVIQIKSKTGAASYADRYLQTASSLYNGLYPLTFTGAIDVQPSITDPSFFTYINCTSWDVNTWQMPDGRYLVENGSGKFPTPSTIPGNVICGFENGNYFKSNNNWFADPYNSNANYFIGETSYMRTAYTVYPINLEAAGLTAWQIICDAAPESAQITCSRNDVKGLNVVYKNGYFFLPSGVTPQSGDFVLDGAIGASVDTDAKTVTLTYNPDLAIVEEGVTVEQGWQTAGRDSEVMLLRVTAKPFKDAINTTMTVNLKDGSEANISSLKLYEANSSSPEIYSIGDGAPTKTEVATASISGSTATFSIGNLAAGTHYYWIGATVSSEATLGAIIDAAVTGITYTCNENETTLDLTSVGDPADRGAMVFNAHSYPFLPRDNGSRVYRIPAMVVADDGSIVVAADKRYQSHTDIGNGHVIDIVIRRSTDGGKTWSEPIVVAKGLGTADDAKCGYGDPSLVKGKDGKLYCLFVAGNIGYFYGQKRIAMTTSTDNGVTWSSSESTPPIDLLESGRLQNYNTVGEAGYGLYDYFVTSGRGLYIPEDDILMYLIPAQTMTSATEHTGNSQNYIFYSTDGGDKWYFSPQIMFQGGDEAKIIQMNDGSLLGSVRQAYNRGFNTATYTKNNDGTLSFTMGTQWNNSQLNAGGSANNQDILYYQRETVTGKTDVIIHSMTTGSHANFKLYYSTDQGANWTEFLNVQTKGTRYVTMDKNPANGSLYLFFEDQSLNSAGGYTDYNHYPLNFIEITRDQLCQLIPFLNDEATIPTEDVKIVYGTSGEAKFGSWSGLTWTSNATSGVEGLTMTLSDGSHDKFSDFNSRYNLAYHPAAANTNSTLTLTAPDGYIITGYSVQTGVYQAATYTLTPSGGTPVTPANLGSTYTPISVSGLSATSTTITVTTTDANKWLSLANFVVSLTKPITYTRTVTPGRWGTICVPGAVTAENISGAEIYRIVGKTMVGEQPGSIKLEEVTEMEAGKPYLFLATYNQLSLTYTEGGSVFMAKNENGLFGSFTGMDVAEGMYLLSDNTIKLCGTGCSIGENRAYINMSEVPVYDGGGSVKSIKIFVDPATGIVEIDDERQTKDDAIYDLSGRRVAKPTRGVYIVNGRKVVVK